MADLSQASRQVPTLLVEWVAAGLPHYVITRQITDIADAITRQLLAQAEASLGPAPVPYLWLACGSQGRQEQSSVSDQDNCLFLDDSAQPSHLPYFDQLARQVCAGLHACGYNYCPGDMMASNPRWRQPVRVWRNYFHTWSTTHRPESQMLASVMFDLRPISGQLDLFSALEGETLEKASQNSIFVAHMVANSLKRRPPVGLLPGFSTLKTGPHRGHIDMKHNGVIPVTDLARVYALKGRIKPVNTRERLQAAQAAGVISSEGGRELLAAYDTIAMMRLQNQANRVSQGLPPSNYLLPAELSSADRSALRKAFITVRTMQAAIEQHQGALR